MPPGFDEGGFDVGALAEFWAQAGKSATQAQGQAGRMVAEVMRATPGMGGDAPAFAAHAFAAPALAAPAFATLTPDTAELRRELRARTRQGRPAPAAAGFPLTARRGRAGRGWPCRMRNKPA